jgi:photosystem II stability/assembly factor-like uncharacterized protein
MMKKSLTVLALAILLALPVLAANQWQPLGPDGGDVRSLAYDPKNPDRIFLGTSAGKLFLSVNGGASWIRYVHLGIGDDYVLDNIAIDPVDSNKIYVAAWSVVDNNAGDIFRSTDGGQSWRALPGMSGKSVRALELAPSNPKIIVAGALDGVHRSLDGGNTWEKITPDHNPDLRNFESVAIDPVNPEVIYAGTWHLPWKTTDGGKTWSHMKKGIIDDSDVFSIIVDPKTPSNVYASACSGIYHSVDTGEEFHKVQGMPFSARRTRVLMQDPNNSQIVYAGTTEGLWKTTDAGKTFRRMTGPNVIVNDVMIDPRNSSKVLLATDRSGVLSSVDGAETFTASNRGFAHRQITALVVDRNDPETLYTGVINDKEFGGVFISRDAGLTWHQINAGLGERDVFTLRQAENGALVAGTNRGIFTIPDPVRNPNAAWSPLNVVMTEKMTPRPVRKAGNLKMVSKPVYVRSELSARVSDVHVRPGKWYAATSIGLLQSSDKGATWRGGAIQGQTDFVAVASYGQNIAAVARRAIFLSYDDGLNWSSPRLPSFISVVRDVAFDNAGNIWVASREGLWVTKNDGESWDHSMDGVPAMDILSIHTDAESKHMIAIGGVGSEMFESNDGGRRWHQATHNGYPLRGVVPTRGRIFAFTRYDGVVSDGPVIPQAVSQTSMVSGSNQ